MCIHELRAALQLAEAERQEIARKKREDYATRKAARRKKKEDAAAMVQKRVKDHSDKWSQADRRHEEMVQERREELLIKAEESRCAPCVSVIRIAIC